MAGWEVDTAKSAPDKLRLHGFNNLDNHLGVNLYQACCCPDPQLSGNYSPPEQSQRPVS